MKYKWGDKMEYKTAQAWKYAAEQRPQGVSDAEVARRKKEAKAHALQVGKKVSADVWGDYMLYITGKMDMEEYQAYLLFKHARCGT